MERDKMNFVTKLSNNGNSLFTRYSAYLSGLQKDMSAKLLNIFIIFSMLTGCMHIGGIDIKNEHITKTVMVHSNGAKTGFQMQFIRLHKGSGTDGVIGEYLHLYLGSDIDDDFFGVRFYEADSVTPIVHRRMISQAGQYADFILKLDIPPIGQTKLLIVDSVAKGGTTESSDAALININFYGWVRQGQARNGFIEKHWGIENTILWDGGRFRSWYTGPDVKGSSVGAGAGGLKAKIRYAESIDGVTWQDFGAATGLGPYEGQGFVYKDSDGLYHMMYSDNNDKDGVNDYRYLTSPSGDNGTWSVITESAFLPGGVPGNISFWKEGDNWHLLYEWFKAFPSGHQWVTSYATGPALNKLTKYNNGEPVLSGLGMIGGIEIHKVGSTYYVFGHAGEVPGNLPTSIVVYRSTDLISWSKVGWGLLRYYHNNSQAQVADPTVQEFNGKTYMWYESLPDQDTRNVPNLSLAIFDQPLSRLFDPTITTAILDDLVAEGWKFDSGYGENNTNTLATVFRKFSDMPSAISPNSVIVKTEPGRYLRIRKAIGTLATENIFEFYARAEQLDKKFECFRIDKSIHNDILAGVYFDKDGKIKYYNGTTSTIARTYAASAYYRFQISQKTTGYDLKINGETIATDIPYYSTYSTPTHFYISQDEAATGYISGLYTRQYSPPASEPTWNVIVK